MSEADWFGTVRAAGVVRRLKAGECLFRQGSRALGLFEVLDGKVRLTRVDSSGREAVLHVAGRGETIAEASLFAASYHCDAIASTDANVRLYPKATLLAEFERNPKAAHAFMAMLARQVMTLRTRLEQRSIHSARERVRHYLTLHGADRRAIVLSGTLKELAAELGLTHEALYRTLARMQQDGAIDRRDGTIRLLRIL